MESPFARSLAGSAGSFVISHPCLVVILSVCLATGEREIVSSRAHTRAFRNLRGSSPGGSFAAEGSCGFCGSTRGERFLSSAASPDVLQLNPSKAARSVQRLPLPFLSPPAPSPSLPPPLSTPATLQHRDGPLRRVDFSVRAPVLRNVAKTCSRGAYLR